MRKSNFARSVVIVVAVLICFSAIAYAHDATQVQTQLETTYSRPVPVQVINTPLPTKVVSEPTTTRNVNVVGEPATPRDVNVVSEPTTARNVNVINEVSAVLNTSTPLPVSMVDNSVPVTAVIENFGHDPAVVYTVPLGKNLLITDIINQPAGDAPSSFNTRLFTETGTLIDIPRQIVSTFHLAFNTGLLVHEGQTVYAQAGVNFQYHDRLTITGRLIDVN